MDSVIFIHLLAYLSRRFISHFKAKRHEQTEIHYWNNNSGHKFNDEPDGAKFLKGAGLELIKNMDIMFLIVLHELLHLHFKLLYKPIIVMG